MNKIFRKPGGALMLVAAFSLISCSDMDSPVDNPVNGNLTTYRIVNLSTLTADFVAQNTDVLTGTLQANVKITIADSATVTLDGVTIKGESNNSYDWAGLTCAGSATLILQDGSENVVKGFHNTRPGIYVPSGSTLTIKGTGTLTASSNGLGAGIGGGNKISCGNIIIVGGTITASGGNGSAGIGGGTGAYDSNTCGAITISGGIVTATGGENAPGIGGGYSSGAEAICGDITITDGTVTAKGGKYAAGIGSGYAYGNVASCGNILISGGIVEAEGSDCSAGIGGGAGLDTGMGYKYESQCGTITIENTFTSVKAIKGAGATNSIGAGNYTGASSGLCICGTVTVGGVEGAVTTSPYTYQP